MAARPRLLLAIVLAAVSAVVLAACGSDEDVGEIPQASADAMLSALEQAQSAQESGDCAAIEDAATSVADEANGLPESEVRRAVIAGAESLHDLAKSDQCGPSTTGRQGPEEEATTTTTTPTPTTTTEETTTTTTTEKPPKPKPKPKPQPQPGNEGGGGLGQGNQGGQPPPETGGTGGGNGPG